MARGDFVNDFLDQLADAFIQRVMDRVNLKGGARNGLAGTRGHGARRGPSPMKGRKLDMACRYPGCKNGSKGPKFHFLCEKHLKEPGWPAAKKAIASAPKE